MIYGIFGASNSGKTTLAQMSAEALAITFVKTSITESAKRHGFDAVSNLSLHDRIDLQYHLLSDMVELIGKTDRPAILDRTPLDMISYMLCEVNMHSHKQVSDKDLTRIEDYVDECYDATTMYFDHVFFVHRLDFYQISDTRPPVNPGYATHSEIVMRGALGMLEGSLNMSIIESQDINVRVDHVTDLIEARLNGFQQQIKESRSH